MGEIPPCVLSERGLRAQRQALGSENSQWFPPCHCWRSDEQISNLQTTYEVAFSSSSSLSQSVKPLLLTVRNRFWVSCSPLHNFPPHISISAADRQKYAHVFVVKCHTGPSQVVKRGEVIEGCIYLPSFVLQTQPPCSRLVLYREGSHLIHCWNIKYIFEGAILINSHLDGLYLLSFASPSPMTFVFSFFSPFLWYQMVSGQAWCKCFRFDCEGWRVGVIWIIWLHRFFSPLFFGGGVNWQSS